MDQLKCKLTHSNAKLPVRKHEGDAGLDIYAVEHSDIPAGTSALLPTGLHVEIPLGYVGVVKPRSGMATSNTLDILAGVIDAPYRGEIKVALMNHGERVFEVKPGDRIAQLLIVPVALPEPIEVKDLSDTDRGAGGFGSSGRRD